MIIILTPDIEQALAEAAQKLGTTPEQLALDSLRERFASSTEDTDSTEEPATLADLLRGHIGALHSREHVPGGARLSQDSSGKFAAGLAAQRQPKSS
jgi:hypothetical protein